MTNRHLVFAVVILCGVDAHAVPAAKQLLGGPMQEIQRAGFSTDGGVAVPPAPAGVTSAVALQAQPPADHAKEVLRKFSGEILASQGLEMSIAGEIAAKLGFPPSAVDPNDAKMHVKAIYRRNSTTKEEKDFGATTVRGKTEIILGYQNERELHAYLVTPDGTLEAAVISDANGLRNIPLDQAKAGYENELGFWVRYYDKTHPNQS